MTFKEKLHKYLDDMKVPCLILKLSKKKREKIWSRVFTQLLMSFSRKPRRRRVNRQLSEMLQDCSKFTKLTTLEEKLEQIYQSWQKKNRKLTQILTIISLLLKDNAKLIKLQANLCFNLPILSLNRIKRQFQEEYNA